MNTDKSTGAYLGNTPQDAQMSASTYTIVWSPHKNAQKYRGVDKF